MVSPDVKESGGAQAYFSALDSLWKIAGGSHTVFNSSPFLSIARFLTVVFIGGCALGAPCCSAAKLCGRQKRPRTDQILHGSLGNAGFVVLYLCLSAVCQ